MAHNKQGAGSDVAERGKWQFVRLIDIFFLGPFMMLLAYEIRRYVAEWKWMTLYFFGITTIAVNLYFYLKIAKHDWRENNGLILI